MKRILEDNDYREIFRSVARECKLADYDLLRSITELEESKLGLARRPGIYQELRRLVNKRLDEGGG